MIIEDEEDLAEVYRMTLARDGHDFVDPRAALPGVKDIDPPDIIILDDHLPNAQGSTFIPWFRAIFPDAKILLATADAGVVDNLEYKPDAVRLKPFTIEKFRLSVKELLAQPLLN